MKKLIFNMKELERKKISLNRREAKIYFSRLCVFVAKKVFKIIALLFIFNLFSEAAYPQSDSLFHYLEIAARNNPSIKQKFNEYQAALQKIPQAGSLSDPELTMGVFLSPMELVDGKQVADIRLMQMFPWFGVLKNAKDEMSLMANAKFELMRDTKLQVLYEVQRTWYELFRIQKEISISEKNVEILNIIERLALVKYKSASTESSGKPGSPTSAASTRTSDVSEGMKKMNSGQTSQSATGTSTANSSMQSSAMGASSGGSGLVDIYAIQIETGELENNIESLRSQQKSALARFNAYLNRSLSAPVFIPESLAADSLELTLTAVSDSIMTNNPMLGMLDYEKQSYEAREKMVSRMGYPMLGLGLNYSLISKTDIPMGAPEMNGKDMLMPMVAITLPIYRKKYNAMKNEAEFLKTATTENLQATSNSLQVEYYQAMQLYQDSWRRKKLYDNQYSLASKSLDIIMKDFSSSAAGLTDVLRVRQQTFNYELKQAEAVADFNTAVAWLKRLGNL